MDSISTTAVLLAHDGSAIAAEHAAMGGQVLRR